MVPVGLDPRILGGDRGETLVPVGHRVDDAVGLGGRRHLFRRAGGRELEGEPHDPVAAAPGEHRLLDRELVLGAGIEPAADLRILALDVLADDHHVDVVRPAVRERRAHALEQFGRAQVDVLVEAPPDRNQHVPQRDVVRHPRHSDRAEIDRIELRQPVEPVLGHDPAGLVVGRAIPVEPGEIERDPEAPRRRLDRADAFRHDFGADAVAGDDRDPVPAHSAPSSPSLSRSLGRTPLRRLWRDRSPLSRQPPAAARAASASHLSDQSPSE